MKIPRTIGFRITLGFGLLIIAIIINAILTHRIVSGNQSLQEELSNVQEPSLRLLIEMRTSLHQSSDLLDTWMMSGRDPESDILMELGQILQVRIPELHRKILPLSDYWRNQDAESYNDLYALFNDSVQSKTLIFTRKISPDTAAIPDFIHSCNALDNLIQVFDRHTVQSRVKLENTYIKTRKILLVSSILIALSAILIAFILYLALVNPIKQYRDTITSMGKGVIPEKKFREGSDEMGQIGIALNGMIKGLRDLSEFAEQIGKGNFRSDFTPQSDQDILGNSLIRLRADLHNAVIEEEKRKREDESRNWSNQGIARFSEILREHSDDSQSLATRLISELVNYLGARVGGIFIIRKGGPEDGMIDLIASYAYDREKHIKKRIHPGEGLVGRCIQEGSTIFLTDIPDDYIRIKSGLGEDKPKSLLIVPIRLNELIIGVIEIASLEVLPEFQIEFVERIGSSIASSFSGEQVGSSKPPKKDPES